MNFEVSEENGSVLWKCRQAFLAARGSVVEAMPLLHQISTELLWSSRYSSFGEFCDDCGISRSQASKLVRVWEHYSIQGGLPVSQLHSVDPERLYLGMGLKGTPEEQYSKALALSRGELREEAALKPDGSEHEFQENLRCTVCGKTKEFH